MYDVKTLLLGIAAIVVGLQVVFSVAAVLTLLIGR